MRLCQHIQALMVILLNIELKISSCLDYNSTVHMSWKLQNVLGHRAKVFHPWTPGYEDRRKIHMRACTQKPAVIVQPRQRDCIGV